MLVVSTRRGQVTAQDRVPLDITSPAGLLSMLRRRGIDTVICGGIRQETRETLTSDDVTVIDNVACSAEQAVVAIAEHRLRSGYGFHPDSEPSASVPGDDGTAGSSEEATGRNRPDCLGCEDRVCLEGRICEFASPDGAPAHLEETRRILEAATDISSEEERQLCRLAELVYFCMEMRYRRIGIAFCEDLREPAQILAGVLDRSFETVSACCRIGGPPSQDGSPGAGAEGAAGLPAVTCNPMAQAAALNRAETDLNVIVGLCMGADCIFARESRAPVTTLFVKDRSLANNPIGAVYSEYYLRESVSTARPWPPPRQNAEGPTAQPFFADNDPVSEEGR
jgi:uncharacterized metal-binding protein